MKKVLGFVLVAVFCLVMVGEGEAQFDSQQGIQGITLPSGIEKPAVHKKARTPRKPQKVVYPVEMVVGIGNEEHFKLEPGNVELATLYPAIRATVQVIESGGEKVKIFITDNRGYVSFYADNGDVVEIYKAGCKSFSFELESLKQYTDYRYANPNKYSIILKEYAHSNRIKIFDINQLTR